MSEPSQESLTIGTTEAIAIPQLTNPAECDALMEAYSVLVAAVYFIISGINGRIHAQA